MPGLFTDGPLRQSMRHLFNADPEAGYRVLREHLAAHPGDPLAYALMAAVRFYHHVSNRMPEWDSQTIGSLLLGSGLPMTVGMKKEIGADLRRAQTLAAGVLAAQPDDIGALIALCVAEGVNRDGMALVSKQWSASFTHAQKGLALARRLLEKEPAAHDAYFVFGSTEYLWSRIPGAVRAFVRIPGVRGDRGKAIEWCRIAAQSGWYCQDFARRTLVNLYAEEGRLTEAIELLGRMAEEFPGNSLLRVDLGTLKAVAARKAG